MSGWLILASLCVWIHSEQRSQRFRMATNKYTSPFQLAPIVLFAPTLLELDSNLRDSRCARALRVSQLHQLIFRTAPEVCECHGRRNSTHCTARFLQMIQKQAALHFFCAIWYLWLVSCHPHHFSLLESVSECDSVLLASRMQRCGGFGAITQLNMRWLPS